jgi:hypothetical protein
MTCNALRVAVGLCCEPVSGFAADVPQPPATTFAATGPPIGFNCGGKCAATFLVGPQLDTLMTEVFGVEDPLKPVWRYKFGDSVLVGGALSYRLINYQDIWSIEAEAGVGQRFGALDQTEGWIALYARWGWFPWNHVVRTTVAISTGLNYASSATDREISGTPGDRSQRLMHYLAPEITFALPQSVNSEFLIRLHHRSGGGYFWGDNVPVYGGLFRSAEGGVQYVAFGLRQRF